MMEKASVDKEKETGTELDNKEDKDILKECTHCSNHPYIGIELEPMLFFILRTYYGEWKTNKQVRLSKK